MAFDSTTYIEPPQADEEVQAPYILLADDVIIAGREAYLAGRLSAQGPTPACRYRDESGRPCVIGAAVPDDIAHAWADEGIASLVEGRRVITDNLTLLWELQQAHDQWTDPDRGVTCRPEAKLRRLLGL